MLRYSLGTALLITAQVGLISCSGGGDPVGNPSTPDSSTEGGFKNASIDSAVAGSGITSLIALSFAVPSNGYAWVSATGTCSVVEQLPVSSVLAAHVETSPTDQTPHPGDSEFTIGGLGAEPSEGSFAVMRVIPVTTDGNAVYLNITNPSAGGKLYCSASITALFRGLQLP
jgi:hypothetical protein